MSTLLSIILVGKSSRGANILYAYPPSPQSVPRTTKPIYPSGSSSDSDDEAASSEEEEEGQTGVLDTYLNFPVKVLASLLSPNRELCDQPFELVVDHLAFVGHPVWLGDDEPLPSEGNDNGEERGRTRRRGGDVATEVEGEVTELASYHDRDKTVAPGSRNIRTLSEPATTSRRPSPITLARSPSSSSIKVPLSSLASSQQSQSSVHGGGRFISFNFLCVIDTPPDSHLSSHLEGYYKDVIIPMTANIKALELKKRWLGEQAMRIRRAREKYTERGLSPSQYLASLPSISPLAAVLCQIYTSLKQSLLVTVTLDQIPVQLLLRGEVAIEDHGDHGEGYHEDANNIPQRDAVEENEPTASPHPRTDGPRSAPLFSRMRRRPRVKFSPWETLLPLENPQLLKGDVEEGTLLWRFLDICSPTLSFAEYEILLDVESEESSPLREIVEHLVHWRKGRITDVVSLKGNYAIRASFDTTTLPLLTRQFSALYPSLPPLPVLLSHLSQIDSFASLVPAPHLRAIYLEVLIWLLRESIVDKIRSYVRIVVSDQVKRDASMHWGTSRNALGRNLSVGEMSGVGAGGGGGSDQDNSPTPSRDEVDYYGSNPLLPPPLLRRISSRHDLADTKAMQIVGSALSNSPPPSTSYQSLRMRMEAKKRNFGFPGMKRTNSNHTFDSGSERPEESHRGPSVMLEPGRPSAAESRWLAEICRDKDPVVVEKFERTRTMLNGLHHFDEIRSRARLSRRDLRVLLSAFEKHLIIFSNS